jgi:SAM-dependent methyltransferase
MTIPSAAALAFDTVAPHFDTRFGGWQSVAAQRRAVRRALLATLPRGGRVLELGGGTGEDAVWMAQNSFEVLLTDASPAMVAQASRKLAPYGMKADIAAAEDLPGFARRQLARDGELFDAAFSNFAPLNCVENMSPVAQGLAALVRPGGHAILVLFGCHAPGEIITETLRGRPRQAWRRFARGPKPARINGRPFTVIYHRRRALMEAMMPWFRLSRRTGIGIFVPPSAAEPWISTCPRFLQVLEALDRLIEHPLAARGDHILYQFERTQTPAP